MDFSVLFVCLGNICRSPVAEAVFRNLVNRNGLNEQISIDSCGIIGFHSGDQADRRMRTVAVKRGIEVTSIARQFDKYNDFDRFDLIIGMDNQNIRDLKRLAQNSEHISKIYRMTDFCTKTKIDEVPDPYYGGEADFNQVLDILEDACEGLLEKIKRENL